MEQTAHSNIENATESTQDLVSKFSEKVKGWDIQQSKPIDLFKKGLYCKCSIDIFTFSNSIKI